jgi:hypothetical protein
MRTWIVALAVACGNQDAVKPRPARPPRDVLVEGDATGCPDGWRRFSDRREPTRFSFCAPHGARVGWFSGSDEISGTIDYAYDPIDDSAQFGLSISTRMPTQGLGPYDPPKDAVFEFDRADDRIAGRAARHYRMHFHVHRERSYELDDNHDHPPGDETSDHEQDIEVWALPFGAGKLEVTLRTQDNTGRETRELLRRIAATVWL